MEILVFSDVRTSLELPQVNQVDLVVLLGRIPRKMVLKIEQFYKDVPILGLFSNYCNEQLYDDTRVIPFHKNVVQVKELRIAGFGGAPSEGNSSYGLYTEAEAEQFIKQLSISNVDILFSYSHPAYGDIKSSMAADGCKSYGTIILNGMAKMIVHGRLQMDFKRKMGNVDIYSIYPYKLISI